MIDELFVPYFQKEISINLGSKTLRKGRLLLFSVKDFYLHFTLVCDNVTKIFELPYPFIAYLDEVEHALVLDYKIKSFTKDLPNLSDFSRALYHRQKHMKFFDNTIRVIES
jgi:hypothetical protein